MNFSINFQFIKWMLAAFIFVVICLSIIHIFDQNISKVVRLIDLEDCVKKYYAQDSIEKIKMSEIENGWSIEGFCVLGGYESRVTEESDAVIKVNSFLESEKIVGSENHWYLIVKTSNGMRIAKFNHRSVPLISPRPAYEKKNCVISKSIVFTKDTIMIGGGPFPMIGGGPKSKCVINIHPGD